MTTTRPLLRGQAGRPIAKGLQQALQRQGFLITRHFLERLQERALQQGVRFSPSSFSRDFQRAKHYRQTRPGYTSRIALLRGMPILYRIGGRVGNRIKLIGMLPQGALPPVAAISPPRQVLREAFLYELAF